MFLQLQAFKMAMTVPRAETSCISTSGLIFTEEQRKHLDERVAQARERLDSNIRAHQQRGWTRHPVVLQNWRMTRPEAIPSAV